MKVAIIQPAYSAKAEDIEKCFAEELRLMDEVEPGCDLIVLPEYIDVPAKQKTAADFVSAVEKYNGLVMAKAAETAVRCHSMVFVNASYHTEEGWRNTTHAMDRTGHVVGRYYKAHPAPGEEKNAAAAPGELDVSYSYRYAPPSIVEMEGLRFAFLTCYDFYMYELLPVIAREKPDIIIGCSHQRTDTHAALDFFGRFISYQTNAYLLRSSVSMGPDSPIGGCSMAVSPSGEMLLDMKSEVGIGTVEIDPKAKYFKPAGFGGVVKSHHEYIEDGRRPWLYRSAGPMMVPDNDKMPYPRLCAHRGFSAVAPENSLPAYGAAVAMGAEEIEFDLRLTKDNVLVSCHDRRLSRVSDGEGLIEDHTYEELTKLDFGVRFSEAYRGLKILTFEEILRKFSGTVVMNVHVKMWDDPARPRHTEEIVALIRKYGAEHHCYLMNGNTEALLEARRLAPEIGLCQGANMPDPTKMVDVAIENRIPKVQFYTPAFYDPAEVKKAKEHGITVNYCQAETAEDALRVLADGVDTVMTNNYLEIANAVDEAYPGLRYSARQRKSLELPGNE